MLHISAIIMLNVGLALPDCFFPFAFVVAELQTNAKPGAEKVVSRSPGWVATYSRTYYEAIPVFSKTRIMEECTVLRMLGL